MKATGWLKKEVRVYREKRKLRKNIIKLREYVQEQEALVRELEYSCAEDLQGANQKLYEQALEEINYREQMMRFQVRQMIAQYLQHPTVAERILGKQEG